MRLTQKQIQTIKAHFETVFGSEASLRLFGSRLDNQQKGGDSDLLVYSKKPIDSPLHKSASMVAKIQLSLGEIKVDVIVIDPTTSITPFHTQILKDAVPL